MFFLAQASHAGRVEVLVVSNNGYQPMPRRVPRRSQGKSKVRVRVGKVDFEQSQASIG